MAKRKYGEGSIGRYGDGFRAQVFVQGKRSTKAGFVSERDARRWATLERERLLNMKDAPPETAQHAVREMIEDYIKDVLPTKNLGKGAPHEEHQARAFLRDFPELVDKNLSDFTTADLEDWRDARLDKHEVAPATLVRNYNWLRHAFRTAYANKKYKAELGHRPWEGFSPLRKGRDEPPADRDRIFSDVEVERLCTRLGYEPYTAPQTKSQEVALVLLVALRTAMRAGEILSLGKATLDLAARTAKITSHKTRAKTGRAKVVPLIEDEAVRLLQPVAKREKCFTIMSASLDTLFRKARDDLAEAYPEMAELHFHDSRGTAATRWGEMDPQVPAHVVAGIMGITVARLMKTYYRPRAERTALRYRIEQPQGAPMWPELSTDKLAA